MQQRNFIKDHHEMGESPEQIKEKLDIEFGKQAYSISSVYRIVALIKCGNTNASFEPRPGRGIDEQLLKRISDIIEEMPCASVRYIAHMLKSNESTVFRYLTMYLHKKYVHTRWVPHLISEVQKKSRVQCSKELLNVLLSCKKTNWHNIITGDQSWFSFSYGVNGAWLDDGENPPECECGGIYSAKIMVTVIWGVYDIYLIDFLPENESFNSEYFIQNILIPISSEKTKIWSDSIRRKIWLHLDNSPIHNSKVSMEKTFELGFKRAPHPAFSPDISPTDFFLWGYVKDKLKGSRFNDADELLEAITEKIMEILKELRLNVFNHWIERCEYIISHKGSYYHKD